jgi:hypothetical protein
MPEIICPFLSARVNMNVLTSEKPANKPFVPCQTNCAFYDKRMTLMPNKTRCLLSFMALNLGSKLNS